MSLPHAEHQPASPNKTNASTRRPKPDADPQQHPIRVTDLRELVAVASPTFAPSGDTIAFTAKHVCCRNGYQIRIYTVPASGKAEPTRFTNGPRDTKPTFTPDGSRIVFISNRSGPHQLYAIPTNGGEPTQLTRLAEGVIRDFQIAPDGKRIIFAYRETPAPLSKTAGKKRRESGESEPPLIIDSLWNRLDGDGYFAAARFALFSLDLDSGALHRLYSPEHHDAFTFDISPDSTTIAVTANRHRNAAIQPEHTQLLLIDATSGKATPVTGLPRGIKTTPKWAPDGSRIAYAGRTGTDGVYSSRNLDLYICDPDTGEHTNLTAQHDHSLPAVYSDDAADSAFAQNFHFHPSGKRLYYRLGQRGAIHIAEVPAAGGAPSVLTRGQAEHDPGAVSPAGDSIALVYADPATPPELALLTPPVRTQKASKSEKNPPKTRKARRRTRFNHAFMRTRTVARPEDFPVTSADGTPVDTRVLFPPDADPKRRLPAVLTIHGGPHAQYGSGFFHELQTLAASGYAVVFPNPRGSKGYGEAYCDAIRGAWGSVDLDDVNAVMDAMRAHPRIDARRVAAIGGSYGGYIVNWLVATRDDIAAAISDRCVSDIASHLGTPDM